MTKQKDNNQKLKMQYLMEIFLQETDESHGLSIGEIIKKLSEKGVRMSSQTVRKDIATLSQEKMDIIMEYAGKNTTYHVGQRLFSTAELKILCDTIQSSVSITKEQSEKMLVKLKSMASKYDAAKLQRQTYLAGRVKTKNRKIFYNIDTIHEAIDADVPITFHYLQWNIRKELVPKHDEAYLVSPWSLMYDDECYYLVAYDHKKQMKKHFRVDKMEHVEIIKDTARKGLNSFENQDVATYSNRHFGMFGAKNEVVTLECKNWLANVIVDRFGCEITMIPVDDDHFRVTVPIVESRLFYGWIVGFGTEIEIIDPDKVREHLRDTLMKVGDMYK